MNAEKTRGTLIVMGVLAGLFLAIAGIAGCTGTGDTPGDGTAATEGTQTIENGQYPPDGMRTNGTRPQMDLATVAARLGVTEDQLREALGTLPQGASPPGEPGTERRVMMNWTAAAEKLGVSEEDLIAAMGIPRGMGNQTAPSLQRVNP